MNADGTGQTRRTDNPASDTNPSWSADGTKIAFTSFRPGLLGEVFVMNADKEDLMGCLSRTYALRAKTVVSTR
jgi:Tol biopolymer transport system component